MESTVPDQVLAHLRSDKLFYYLSLNNSEADGWYIYVHGGKTRGPFGDRFTAESNLKYIKTNTGSAI